MTYLISATVFTWTTGTPVQILLPPYVPEKQMLFEP